MLMMSLALLTLASSARADSINIAAIVNDDVITTTDVNDRRDLVMAMNGIAATTENQQKISPRILQSLVNEALEMQEAKRLSVTVSEDDIAKAIVDTETERHLPAGGVRGFITSHNLSMRSLESQLKANVAWTKVVQRKLRRNVTISEDEIARAQQAEAAAPGITELRLAALVLPVAKPADEARVSALATQLVKELKGDSNMGAVALAHQKDNVQAAPPRWVREDSVPLPLGQALAGLKPDEVTPPLRVAAGFQILQLIERRVTKPLPDSTEVAVKEIRILPPSGPGKEAMEAVREQTLALRAHPGSCNDNTVDVPNAHADVHFLRAKLGTMEDELRSILTHLNVGDISEPIITPQAIELILLCERIEPATTSLPDADPIRQKLFAEKLELEAEKHLRDLRRDAYINIKGPNGAGDAFEEQPAAEEEKPAAVEEKKPADDDKKPADADKKPADDDKKPADDDKKPADSDAQPAK